MLLSKRPEMSLPEKWPAYFKYAKGCYIKDLDGNKANNLTKLFSGERIHLQEKHNNYNRHIIFSCLFQKCIILSIVERISRNRSLNVLVLLFSYSYLL